MEIQVSPRDVMMMTSGISLILAMMDEDLREWQPSDEYPMDSLFELMEFRARAADLWVRLQEATGVDRKTIARRLQEYEEDEE